jgi:hypothetical protein
MITPMALEGLDQWIGFIFAVVFALVVLGEAQQFYVHLFQPLSERTRIHYDVNLLHHYDLLATPVLILAGWGWGSKTVAEPPYFPDSSICRAMKPLSGGLASILLAGIFGSINMFVPFPALEVAVKISVLMGVANLIIPIPPLGLGRALCAYFGIVDRNLEHIECGGALLITALILLENLMHWPLLQAWVGLLAPDVSKWILSA